MNNKDLIPAEGWHVMILDNEQDRQLSIPVVFWYFDRINTRILAMIPAPLGETADLFPAHILGGELQNGIDLSRYDFLGYGIGEDSPMADRVISAVGSMVGDGNDPGGG